MQLFTKQRINPTILSALLITLIIVMLGITLGLMRRATAAKATPTQQAYAKFIKLLAPYHLSPKQTESAIDFASRVGQQLPQLQQQVVEIATLYNYLMYSRYPEPLSDTHLRRLNVLILQFAQSLKSSPS